MIGSMSGFSRAFSAAAVASATITFSESSSNCLVLAEPTLLPRWIATLTWRSNCTMFAVIVELANRVAERSPPLNSTSTASALAMFMILSAIALTSSREYIGAEATTARDETPRGHREGLEKRAGISLARVPGQSGGYRWQPNGNGRPRTRPASNRSARSSITADTASTNSLPHGRSQEHSRTKNASAGPTNRPAARLIERKSRPSAA